MDVLTLILISLPAGFLGALVGLGGGIILIPLMTQLGVPIKYAIASSIVATIVTSSGSATSYVREGLTNIRVAMFLEIFTVSGAIIGATITLSIPSRPLYFIFASFIIVSLIIYRKRLRADIPTVTKQDRLSRWFKLEGSYYDEFLKREVYYKVTNSALGGLGMVSSGIAAGMLGIGAGIFNVSIHENILKMPPKVSMTTSNFIIGLTALSGAIAYLSSGLIYVDLVSPILIGTFLGSIAGTKILNRLSSKSLRTIFILVLGYALVQMIYKGVTA
ncbi:MAG: sulfite exporter TauE/SafE family protein [Candidatus Caldarchaeales archaeon]